MQEKKLNLSLIIQGCGKGNRNSQRILFEYYMGVAMKICLRYCKNREEAEEVLNNGFLKIFKKINQYDPAYPFESWLRKIMVNTSIDYFRANERQLKFIHLDENLSGAIDNTDIPIMIDDDVDCLPIIQSLPPQYRIVFNLSVMEGYKHDEIAEKLNISASTSRSNLVRAKEKLRKTIIENKLYQRKNPPVKG